MGSRILVVDDVEHNRFLLTEALEGIAEEISSVADGQRALEQIEAQNPEVVVLDFQMPGMHGAEVSRWIKGRANAPFVYVLLLSGYREADATEEIRRSRADRFLGKPFALEVLREAVREGLRVTNGRRLSPPDSGNRGG